MRLKDLKIINHHGKPHGIRDETGFLLFFPPVTRFPGQEKRCEREAAEQQVLAEWLLNALEAFPQEPTDD